MTARWLVGLTLLNGAMLAFSLAQSGAAVVAQEKAPMLRGRGLEIVDDTGRVRDAGELALERERAQRARDALAKLKPSEREAVVLRFEAGLSFKEVAIACGIDEAAARKRVSRALSRLRAELGAAR